MQIDAIEEVELEMQRHNNSGVAVSAQTVSRELIAALEAKRVRDIKAACEQLPRPIAAAALARATAEAA